MPIQNWSCYYYKHFFGFSHIYASRHSAQSVLGVNPALKAQSHCICNSATLANCWLLSVRGRPAAWLIDKTKYRLKTNFGLDPVMEATCTEGMHCHWAKTAASEMPAGCWPTSLRKRTYHVGTRNCTAADYKILRYPLEFYPTSKPKNQRGGDSEFLHQA